MIRHYLPKTAEQGYVSLDELIDVLSKKPQGVQVLPKRLINLDDSKIEKKELSNIETSRLPSLT